MILFDTINTFIENKKNIKITIPSQGYFFFTGGRGKICPKNILLIILDTRLIWNSILNEF
jgi:hypothetical protein